MDFIKKHPKKLILAVLWLSLTLLTLLISEVLMPFALAILLAYVFDPVVTKISTLEIKKIKVPRFVSVIFIYFCLFVILYLFSTILLPKFYQEFKKLGATTTEWLSSLRGTNIQEFSAGIENSLISYGLPVEDLKVSQIIEKSFTDFTEYLRTQSSSFAGEIQALVTGIFGFIFNFFLVLMISAFILVDTARIKRFAYGLVTKKGHQAMDTTLAKLDKGLSGVVRGQLLICLVNAGLTLIGLLILKIKFALVLATIAGICSLIPIFGSIISTIPIAAIAFMTSPWSAALALIWIMLIHGLEANFLNPKILGNSAHIHPVIVVLALVTGEHFYGIFGALLAVPIASILLTLFKSLLTKAQSYDG